MKFGVCCGLDRTDAVLATGFDYVEGGASGFGAPESEPDLEVYERKGIEATNLFFPGSVKLFGPEANDWRSYAERAIRRAAQIGIETMVVGSGGSRMAPEGADIDAIERAFCHIVGQMQEIATPFGILLAPEPLNADECNVGNDQGKLARYLAVEGVGYCTDTYHLLHWWRKVEPDAAVPSKAFLEDQLPTCPLHVHLGDFPGRSWPKPGDTVLAAVVGRLHELGFDGRASLECQMGWPDDLAPALASVRQLFAR